MAKLENPYSSLPAHSFWRSAVAEVGVYGLADLWRSRWQLPSDARFATFGSCFAQHISRALIGRNMGWVDAEPAPRRTPPEVAKAYNYSVFSARTGNIYTATQFLWQARMAAGRCDMAALEIWENGQGRFFDSVRPAIEPGGFASRDEVLLSRLSMVRAFQRSIREADVFIFTLGLTEGWENAKTGQPYPMCPGTAAGRFDATLHLFRNYGFAEVRAALDEAFALMREIHPGLRLLLTVSPVPLTATATGQHVLVATTYSKSVLRAVAGEIATADQTIDYFPSYEIITGAPTRSAFFEPNLRSVVQPGVDLVMKHFFAGLDMSGAAAHAAATPGAISADLDAQMAAEDLVCEEMTLDAYNAR